MEEQIEHEQLSATTAAKLEPTLTRAVETGLFRWLLRLPGESQIRNPMHLKALVASCQSRGVKLLPNREAVGVHSQNGGAVVIETLQGKLNAESVCLTAGAWTGRLLQRWGVSTGILPIRGQMVLYQCSVRPFRHVFNEGPRYLVPRDDGLVLAGSTEEEAGFDASTTPEGMADLERFAQALCPELTSDRIVKRWAGLRPGAFDGFPYMGSMPGMSNVFVAAGHYRSGLHLSPTVAEVMADLITGSTAQV